MEIIGASEFLELNLSLEGTEIKIVNGFFNCQWQSKTTSSQIKLDS